MACPTFIPSLRLKDKIFLLFYPISAGFLRFISSLKSLLSPISPTIICLQFDSLLTQTVKNPPAMLETWVRSLSWEDPLEKGTDTHSSILAWRIPWTEKPGRLQSMRSQRVGYNWVTFTLLSVPRNCNLIPGCFFIVLNCEYHKQNKWLLRASRSGIERHQWSFMWALC